MVVGALAFNRLVLRHMVGRPLISLIMVTLGLGALIRGAVPLTLGAVPGAIPLPIPSDPLDVQACWSRRDGWSRPRSRSSASSR